MKNCVMQLKIDKTNGLDMSRKPKRIISYQDYWSINEYVSPYTFEKEMHMNDVKLDHEKIESIRLRLAKDWAFNHPTKRKCSITKGN